MLSSLHESLVHDSSWTDRSTLLTAIVLIKIMDSSSETPIITHSITVKSDLTWSLVVHGVQLSSRNCSCLSSIPMKLNIESFLSLVSVVEHSSVCPGHPDEHFIAMLEAKKGKLLSKDRSAASCLDTLMINFILKLFAALIVNCLLARGSVHLVFVIEIHLEKYIIGGRNKKAFLLLAGNLPIVIRIFPY